ncbi:hypothetical protein GUITHDRAFT_105655 [Guillardia theta CCMP2712]|uniref:EF-hand domain-containing protein n=1 Tax=Guillardia theta (strain CCMP2712) TaxID=905079 RepID=L1JK30_GUITC|nr:hypothetical protein GUITHDRAFT_105655 [Guillardia theta CCMP2712]EKX48509.1 hypothetical protein GUITHDRAFT_105655 [Guillardia theta CCMP2712]|eukprot:XP_005835489.1 hypothetical protein GUITHDRAFT_105655 [Guillardia theta CCMP2712]
MRVPKRIAAAAVHHQRIAKARADHDAEVEGVLEPESQPFHVLIFKKNDEDEDGFLDMSQVKVALSELALDDEQQKVAEMKFSEHEEALVSLETWEKVLLATFSNLVLENDAEEQELLRERFAIAGGFLIKPEDKIEDIAAKFRKRKVREFYLYLLFCMFFTRPVEQMFDLSKQSLDGTVFGCSFPITTYFKGFNDIGATEDFWVWMVQYLYTFNWYNGSEFLPDFQGTKWRYLYDNVVIQKPRLRQIRVLPVVIKRFNPNQDGSDICYPSYTSGDVDTSPWFGVELDSEGQVRDTVVEYQTSQQLKTASYTPPKMSGKTIAYEGGGHVIDFPLNATSQQFQAMMQRLKARGWTDRRTRVVFFDQVIYNAELNSFVSIRASFEFNPWGDVVLLILDIAVYTFVIVSAISTLIKLWKLRWKFFHSLLNQLDIVNYFFFLITGYYKINLYMSTYSLLSVAPKPEDPPRDFESFGWTYAQIGNWNGFNSLITWSKALVYLGLLHHVSLFLEPRERTGSDHSKKDGDGMIMRHREMNEEGEAEEEPSFNMLLRVISESSKNVSIFSLMFLIVLWAYAQTLYVCFGTDIVRAVNQYLGPLVSFSFLFICLFFMLNTFLALIMKSYQEVSKIKDEDSLSKEFAKGIFPFLNSISARLKGLAKKNKVNDENSKDPKDSTGTKDKKQAWPENDGKDQQAQQSTLPPSNASKPSTAQGKPDPKLLLTRQRTMYRREDDLVEVPLEALQQLTVSLNDLQGKVKSLSDRVRTAECAFLGKKI